MTFLSPTLNTARDKVSRNILSLSDDLKVNKPSLRVANQRLISRAGSREGFDGHVAEFDRAALALQADLTRVGVGVLAGVL